MANRTIPISITPSPPAEPPGNLAAALGGATAAMLSYLIDVVDREDRLESGSGRFRDDLAADHGARRRAVEESVLRSLRLAADPLTFPILAHLKDHGPVSVGDLAVTVGLPRLSVEERISDLVSAGLAAKLSARGQVAGTEAGDAVVALVREAVATGAAALRSDGDQRRVPPQEIT